MAVEADITAHQILSKRQQVLEQLLNEPQTKPELVEALPCSRSTVDRAIEELQEIGCVERTAPNSSLYRGTTLGELMLQTHQEYLGRLQQYEEARPILTELPDDAPIGEDIIRDADVYRSVKSPDIAFRPGQRLMQDATKMVGTAPVVYREFFEEYIDRLNQGSFEFEVIIESEVLELIEQEYSDEFDALTNFDAVTVYRTYESFPYGLWVMDRPDSDTAGITFYNEGGVPGAIVNDSDDAVEWAAEQYAQYKHAASKIV
ncbi:HTH domain-containing protein [Halolamina sp. CBA1230]|uniref:helix-turn-helix transcriptional regulator n=1 Tax=Halolamina sp. CBA1230 TaxID=1853690 RepID=UPI0009A13CA5|nr:HTH domain-containing protein [Halolamina sp. CBA1230]QKY19664.1 HTH domain-containing protein [Halolamina sp. CBA1230]